MKIAVLHPAADASTSPFAAFDPQCDPSPYLPEHRFTHVLITKATAVRQVIDIARQGFDVMINLCDGAWEEDRPGIEVVDALERLNVAFTGAGSGFYEPSRVAMKMAAHSSGVAVPAFVEARSAADAERALDELRFPMIVKHPNSYSSIGLTRLSRVVDAHGLRQAVKAMVETYGAALVEEFIEGREFTVLVAEARHADEEGWALEPVEFCFPAGETFKHFDLKWKDFETMTTRALGDGPEERALSASLREAAALTFSTLGGSGYGRCDFRVDAAGVVYLLEINPNCGIFYPEGQFGSADVILANDSGGHRAFLEHLIACAKRRQALAGKPWELRHRRASGFGMFATRALAEGETVVRYEETSHVLASRGHVARRWHGLKRRWFEEYAWPVSANVNALWSANPEEWRPLNHSCDPNTWLEGLDLVARRGIGNGEQLTVDYATFCGPGMAAFECRCGSKLCRHLILATDHLLPEVRERYRGHVSDFVAAAWERGGPEVLPFAMMVRTGTGLGLSARRAWRVGDKVVELSWENAKEAPSRWTMQRSQVEHAEPLPHEIRYMSHSCRPNLAIDMEAGAVLALRDIAPGDELSCFYPATEWRMAEPFDCACGAPDCLGRIAGAAELSVERLKAHALSPVVRAKLAARERGTP